MKTPLQHTPQPSRAQSSKGFTLIELIVSMTITLLIVGSLIAVTSTALTTFRDSTDSLRGYRQAKAALDQIALDLEAIVIRSGNDYEYLNAQAIEDSTSASVASYFSHLIFLTAATDRYDGDLTQSGDVSCVRYGLTYSNPIDSTSTSGKTFALYRNLTNPDDTFTTYLAQSDLFTAGSVTATDASDLQDASNFICENIREMTVIFNVLYTDSSGVEVLRKIPVLNTSSINSDAQNIFSIKGDGLSDGTGTATDYANGRIVSIDINIQIISDGMIALNDSGTTGLDETIELNTQRFTKTIQIPQL